MLLLIDDDHNLADSMIAFFRHEGVEVLHVKSGSAAEAALMSDDGMDIERVLCDWNLGMYDHRNGAEIVTALEATFGGAEYAIWSGLHQTVPDWCRFFLKDDLEPVIAWAKGEG